MTRTALTIALVVGLMAAATVDAQATSYRFHVSCSDRSFVVEWNTGTIDPGQEWLRVATGTSYGSCSVGDFDPARDGGLPVERKSGPSAIPEGVPILGPILKQLFG